MNKFVKEEDGGLVEYLILIAIAAVAAAFLFPQLRTNLGAWFTQMVANVQNGISGASGQTSTGTSTTLGAGTGTGASLGGAKWQ